MFKLPVLDTRMVRSNGHQDFWFMDDKKTINILFNNGCEQFIGPTCL